MYSRQSCTKKDRGSRCRDLRNGKASEGRGTAEQLARVKDEGAEWGVGGRLLPGRGRSQEAQRAARSTWGQEGGEGGTPREQVQAFHRQNGHCDEGKIQKSVKILSPEVSWSWSYRASWATESTFKRLILYSSGSKTGRKLCQANNLKICFYSACLK